MTPIVQRRPGRVLAASAVMLVALAGCSSNDDGEKENSKSDTAAKSDPSPEGSSPSVEATSEQASADICVPLKGLSEYDKEVKEIVARGGSWSEAQKKLSESLQPVLQAYDDAMRIDSEMKDELKILRDLTASTEGAVTSSKTYEEFAAAVTSDPNLEGAGEAGQALNTFALENCGFATTID